MRTARNTIVLLALAAGWRLADEAAVLRRRRPMRPAVPSGGATTAAVPRSADAASAPAPSPSQVDAAAAPGSILGEVASPIALARAGWSLDARLAADDDASRAAGNAGGSAGRGGHDVVARVAVRAASILAPVLALASVLSLLAAVAAPFAAWSVPAAAVGVACAVVAVLLSRRARRGAPR